MSLTSISSSLLTLLFSFFFFNDTATTEIYTFPYTTLFRSLHLHEPHHHQGDRAGHDRRCAGGRDHHPLAAGARHDAPHRALELVAAGSSAAGGAPGLECVINLTRDG